MIILYFLNKRLPGNVLDITPNINFNHADEISEWLMLYGNNIRQYAIIDNMPIDYVNSAFKRHLFITNSTVGLDNSTADDIIDFFNRK